MKVVLLAGGFGTRISEESQNKPKPMIEIGGMPILWHIMKQYSNYGYNDFIICCGYKSYVIKEYFANYFLHHSDVTFDFSSGKNEVSIHNSATEAWKVTLVDTGLNTMTGGRVRRIKEYLNNEPFMLTYGDGVSDVNIAELVKCHRTSGKLATISAYQPNNRFGVLDIDASNSIRDFREKTKADGDWINAGFMVVEPALIDFIDGDDTVFERYPLEHTAQIGQLNAYKHYGFWQCMDTLRDKQLLEKLWAEGTAPWKVWK